MQVLTSDRPTRVVPQMSVVHVGLEPASGASDVSNGEIGQCLVKQLGYPRSR